MNDTQTENKGPQWETLEENQLGLGLLSEQVNFDKGGDSFAIVAPVQDGRYAATLGPSEDPKSPTLQVKRFPATAEKPALTIVRINATLTLTAPLDPGVDASVLNGKMKKFDKAFSTQVRTRNGLKASEAVTLLNYLGYDVAPGATVESIASTLNEILKSKTAQIGVRTTWKAGFQEGEVNEETGYKGYGSFKIVGMRNFPQIKEGIYNPVVDDMKARAYITDIFPLAKAQ